MNLALFDLDGTLLPIDSDHAFGEFMVTLGWADGQTYRDRNQAFYEQYQAQCLDIAAYIEFATSPWRDLPSAKVAEGQARFMQEVVVPAMAPQAADLVKRHQSQGDLVAVVTATNDAITRPIALKFGVTELLATELERHGDGRPTGRIAGTPSFREGKVARVEQWLAAQGRRREDFERIVFYSDSTNDLALMEWATHPVATNPTAALALIALERGWPILRLFE